MATPKKKPVVKAKKKKRKVVIKETAKVRKKDSVRNDTLPKAPARMYRDTGANFKVKIRRK
jgi:hypothetical protein